ncbi:MAG TPA: c-type cytochrome [Burkholderiales bacterium]|nr:c-type cytochrome [Burkholderiales bacterium]
MLSCVAPCLAQTSPDAATRKAALTLATAVCGRCHGAEGRSEDPAVPVIAGQQQSYIEVQLKVFRTQRHRDSGAHEDMRRAASAWLMNDQIITGIAGYFSSQAPAPGKPGDPALVAAGKLLYQNVNPDRGIPACADCHGVDAKGLSVIPRLAGQHALYLVRQMQMLRASLRDSRIMHGVVQDVNDNEIVAVATYLQSQ